VEFDLVSEWRFEAPAEAVWDRLADVATWPLWWPNLACVVQLEAGDPAAVGARHRVRWTTALPYRLDLETRIVAVDPGERIEIAATGAVDGSGMWTIERLPGGCLARYRWQVRPRTAWMRIGAFMLRPVFIWNHAIVMGRGERGLRELLAGGGADVPAYSPSPASAASSPLGASPPLARGSVK
jgi:uncharacterized protein YndB with AHSA1/START domain